MRILHKDNGIAEAIRLVRAYAINEVRYSPNSMFIACLDTLARVAERPRVVVEREVKIRRDLISKTA